MTTLKISEIVVGNRHRQDLGDIVALGKSVRDLGILQPILITSDNRLVAGRRRLAAAEWAGLEEVPVRVLSGLDDALLLLKAERDENTCRKDFAPSEAVAIGKALEALERPKAKARQREHGKTAPGKKNTCGNLPQVKRSAGKTRDKVAEAVGMSGRTYAKAKGVVAAAQAEPATFGDLPERMDQSGKVDGAHQEMKRRTAKHQAATKNVEPGRADRGNVYQYLEQYTATIEGSLDALKNIELEDWRYFVSQTPRPVERLVAACKAMRQFLMSGDPARWPAGEDVVPAPILEKVSPLLDELDEWGRAHECQMSPVEIRKIAVLLRRLLEPNHKNANRPIPRR